MATSVGGSTPVGAPDPGHEPILSGAPAEPRHATRSSHRHRSQAVGLTAERQWEATCGPLDAPLPQICRVGLPGHLHDLIPVENLRPHREGRELRSVQQRRERLRVGGRFERGGHFGWLGV
jgi:hypothetical protein